MTCRIPRTLFILAGTAGALVSAAAAVSAPDAAVREEGAAVLRQRCMTCHAADKKTAGIDLSTRAGAAAAGAANPDDPAKNRLVRAVVSGKMPPDGKLAPTEVAALRAWVAAGLPYPAAPLQPLKISDQPLWSLAPVRTPAVPKSRFDALAKNPVDRFIFKKLEEAGLRPSPPASRPELLRRVTFDLTGLPPGPEETDAFVKDRSPDAYEKVVDRLLASPAYGERWGRHWLDVVRYGESHGYEQNYLRPNAWPYRDYVIRSFNEDKPYDRFLTEQLAGDVAGKGNPDVEAATGFLVAGVHDTVGNQTEEGRRQQRANDLDDIVSTVGETFLGLTVGCAKCHDHKFDPVPQKDYYRLCAVFSDVQHGDRPLSSTHETAERERAILAKTRELRRLSGELADLDDEARTAVLRAQGVNPVPRPAVSPGRNVDDFPPTLARFIRFVVRATRDGSQPCLDELEAYGPDHERNLALAETGAKAGASSLLPGYAIHQVSHLNDGRYGNDWSWISNEPGAGWAQVELTTPATVSRVVWSRDAGEPAKLSDRLAARYEIRVSLDGHSWETVATGEDRAGAPEAIPGDRLQAARTPEQARRRAELQERIKDLQAVVARKSPVRMAYAGQFTAPEPVYLLRRGDVMQRQEEVTPGALSRIPGLSPELFETADAKAAAGGGARRAALAKWLTDPCNPLTPRVIVNRIWQHHFGRGLVSTPNDFGHNGEKPSHPALLDWLAATFTGGDGEKERRRDAERLGQRGGSLLHVSEGEKERRSDAERLGQRGGSLLHVSEGEKERRSDAEHPSTHLSLSFHPSGSPSNRQNPSRHARAVSPSLRPSVSRSAGEYGCGWRLKKLHRLLVTSYTYRQTSAASPAGQKIDAGNRLLWRMPLRRLEAEALRDAILATSGKLDRRMGGPSYLLFKYRVVNVAIYEPMESYGPETWRRTVYRQPARGIREELLGAFDCPESAQRSPRRESTTTALQALALLNGPFMIQQADFFAHRAALAGGPEPAAQVRQAFRLAFGRLPGAREQAEALKLVRDQGLTALCRALMNANEFLYY